MDYPCLMQEIQAENNQKKALLENVLGNMLLREEISELGEG